MLLWKEGPGAQRILQSQTGICHLSCLWYAGNNYCSLTYRRCLSVLAFLVHPFNAFPGFFTAIVRTLLSAVACLVRIPRLDKPAALGGLASLEKGTHIFQYSPSSC